MQIKSGLILGVALDAIFTVIALAALGLGFAGAHATATAADRTYLSGLHVLVGLSGGLFFFFELIARSIALSPLSPEARAQLRGGVGHLLRLVVNLAFFLLLASGFLRAIYAGEHLQFWGALLLFDVTADPYLAELFTLLHRIVAGILALAIVARIVVALWTLATTGRLFPVALEQVAAEVDEPTDPASVLARKLAKSMSFWGWLAFWGQLLVGLLSTPLLVFGAMGRRIAPGSNHLGDALTWGAAALALLAVAVTLDYYNTRISARLARDARRFMSPKARAPFGFLGVGLVVGAGGIFLSFVGVGMSIALLVAKTVSQPPGIAITDPNKIVRALDVFTLLLNFDLLFAHVLGAGVAAWLSLHALKARHNYVVAETGETEKPALPTPA